MGWASAVLKGGMQVADVAGNISQYKAEKEAGNSTIGSMVKIGADLAIGAAMMSNPITAPIYVGYQVVNGASEMFNAWANGRGRQNAQTQARGYSAGLGGNFVDTQNAATMRQKGLQAMEHSGYNIRSVLGSEARTFYRGVQGRR